MSPVVDAGAVEHLNQCRVERAGNGDQLEHVDAALADLDLADQFLADVTSEPSGQVKLGQSEF